MDTVELFNLMNKVEPQHVTPAVALLLAVINAKHIWRFLTVAVKSLSPKFRKKRTYVHRMQHLNAIQEKMAAIRDLETVDRVVIFAGHNSGGLPRAGSRYYTSALHWEVKKGFSKDLGEYKDIPVDYAYVKMLLESYEESKVYFKTEDADPCLLKTYYEVEGVVESVTYYMDISENNFIYMTVATKKGFTEECKMKLDLLCYATKQIVRDNA